jgi:tRNA nucleotidyltransferase (CCA-adding enzyme)
LTLAGLAVDGYVMMDLGLKGKQVGDALQYLMEKVLDDPSLNEKEKLIDIIKVDILPKYVV